MHKGRLIMPLTRCVTLSMQQGQLSVNPTMN
jgi:hypothetical protein